MTDEDDALRELALTIKVQRERAEAAEAEVERLQRALGKEAQEKLAAQKKLKNVERSRDVYKRKLDDSRSSIKELQDSLDPSKPDETEVIAFFDDCGHVCVVDCTGAAQKLKIYRQTTKNFLSPDQLVI
jgi:predicted RNase H-like nuclease (RuvC/YqgF family)